MEIVRRKACRAIILTPKNDVLLIKIENPDGNWIGWITPGGGMDRNENEMEALNRELYEELGLENFTVESKIWSRFHKFPWNGKFIEQEEVYFLVRSHRFEVNPKLDPSASELMELKEFRWWSLDEILKSSEKFAPSKLPELVNDLVAKGVPCQVMDVGV